jgi:hypothetical protein
VHAPFSSTAICAICRHAIVAKHVGRKARFCSDKCRSAARRARNRAGLGGSSGATRNAANSFIKSNARKGDFGGRASPSGLPMVASISGPPTVIEIEIGADRRRAAPRISNATIRAKAGELIAEIPADLSVPLFLRRMPKAKDKATS